MTHSLTPALASRFAKAALGHVTRQYPNKLDHVLDGPGDAATPRALHPVFYGSFDWHSCVHGWWTLFTLYRLYPQMPEAAAIRELADQTFTPQAIAGEMSYLARASSRGFERPYGWGWLLMLAAELRRHDGFDAGRWASDLQPLAKVFVRRFNDFLPLADYPVRVGVHTNTAFALRLALEYAQVSDDEDFAAACRAKAREWHMQDRDCQAWEPSQDEFLSPALMEAEFMRAALPPNDFAPWFAAFLPRLADSEPRSLMAPPSVSDRSDGKIAHLDGLSLSRAWCWRSLAGALPLDDPRRGVALRAAETHLSAAMEHVTGDYMGEHWLASFALLALRETI